MSRAEIQSDGRTVWVNDSSGCCIGRFGRYGIDVHMTGAEQMKGGVECLYCTHQPTTQADWDTFVAKMLKHHQVTVPNHHRPNFLRLANKLEV